MRNKLPKGWVWTRLGDIIGKVSLTGKKLKQREYQEKGRLPVIDQGHTFIGGYTDKEDLKVCCEPPVIVFGDHTKIVKYVDFDFVAGADGVKVLKPLEVFYPKLFYCFVQAIQLPEKGYARHFQFLEKSFIPLPPLPEQHRIAAKIEELFTKLDAGVEALKKVKTQLKRYRQAVLKYAFEGRLTEEWREAHKGKLEPASVLLEKIKEERKKRTKEEKGKYDVVGAYRNTPLQKDLPQLPEGWDWARLGEVIGKVPLTGKKLKQREYQEKGKFPVIDQGQSFIGGYTDKEDLKVCCKPPVIIFGDHTKIVKYIDFDFVAGADGIKVIKPKEVFYMKLFFYFVQAIELPDKGYARHFHFLEKSLIPLPPFPEQHKIVEEIEHRLSVADEVEKVIEQSLKQAERLRQSILKKAFEGKLVPQDPNDEPAEKLLEKIKTEKAKREVEKEWGGSPKSKAYTKQMRLI